MHCTGARNQGCISEDHGDHRGSSDWSTYQDGGDLAVEQVVSQLGIDHEHFHAVTYKSSQTHRSRYYTLPPLIVF